MKTRLASALIAATLAVAVSACGSTSSIGAAYSAGDYRMSEQQLADLVKESQDAERTLGTQVTATSTLTPAAVNAHLMQAIIFTGAAKAKVSVTKAEIQQVLMQQYQQNGKAAVQGQLAANGYPPRIIEDYARMVLLESKVSQAVTQGQSGSAAQSAGAAFWTKVAGDMNISVSPRYGTWNPQSLSLTPASNANTSPAK